MPRPQPLPQEWTWRIYIPNGDVLGGVRCLGHHPTAEAAESALVQNYGHLEHALIIQDKQCQGGHRAYPVDYKGQTDDIRISS